MRKSSRIFALWISGFIISCFVIWPIGYLLLNSIVVYQRNANLDVWLPKCGTEIRWTSEGWGTTNFGELGTTGMIESLNSKKHKILIWGDSFVEAFQVDDKEKMQSQLNGLITRTGVEDTVGVGIGYSGRNLSDYFFLLPSYEELMPHVISHVIVFQLNDILPNGKTLLDDPETPFKKRVWEPFGRKIRIVFHKMKMTAFWNAFRDFYKGMKKLRFRPGITGKAENLPNEKLPDNSEKYFELIAEKFQKVTNKPVCFVYIPDVPKIKNGVVAISNGDEDLVQTFGGILKTKGLHFINMQKPFVDFWRINGRFPRGFSNSRPDRGHLNSDGHYLVGESIAQWVYEFQHVIQ